MIADLPGMRRKAPYLGFPFLVVLREKRPEVAGFLLVLDAGEYHLGAGSCRPRRPARAPRMRRATTRWQPARSVSGFSCVLFVGFGGEGDGAAAVVAWGARKGQARQNTSG